MVPLPIPMVPLVAIDSSVVAPAHNDWTSMCMLICIIIMVYICTIIVLYIVDNLFNGPFFTTGPTISESCLKLLVC